MEDNILFQALSYFDESNRKFSKYLKNKNVKFSEEFTTSDSNKPITGNNDGVVIFNDETYFNAYRIGSYLHKDETFIWSYAGPFPETKIQLSSKLLKYVLNFDDKKLDRDDFKLIKSSIVNSRIKIKNNHNLDILLGIIIMITKIDFIVPITFNFKNQKISFYYAIPEAKPQDLI